MKLIDYINSEKNIYLRKNNLTKDDIICIEVDEHTYKAFVNHSEICPEKYKETLNGVIYSDGKDEMNIIKNDTLIKNVCIIKFRDGMRKYINLVMV